MEETPDDLTLSAEKAFFILVKARAFDAKVEQTDPDSGSNPSDDKDVHVLEDTVDDPTQQELIDAMEALNVDERFDLLAVMWIGRGDFTAEAWPEVRTKAADLRPEQVPQYLSQTPLLSDYLEEGLNQIGVSLDDFESGRL